MGACCQKDEGEAHDQKLANELEHQKEEDQNINKILFLGTGGSGKSTIFKQLRQIHGAGWDENYRNSFTHHIHVQIIEQMKLAIESVSIAAEQALVEEHGDDYMIPDDVNLYSKLSSEAQNAAQTIMSYLGDKLNEESANACKALWNDDEMKRIYDQRAMNPIMKFEDSSAYFWDKIDDIMASDYVPNETDVLLVRWVTRGVQEQKFTIKNKHFHVFDVGGQRSERKKWIHCFENVTAMIFVVSLSCYDEVMFEDETTNAMVDTLQLFKKMCNNEWFKETNIILFLNKKDLFALKLSENKPITLCHDFVSYRGNSTSFDETTEYIRKKFERKNKSKRKKVYTHLTCATAKDNVQKVFNDVQTIIINKALGGSGIQ